MEVKQLVALVTMGRRQELTPEMIRLHRRLPHLVGDLCVCRHLLSFVA